MTEDQPDNLQAFDDFLEGREQHPEEAREPKQYLVAVPGGEAGAYVDVWADGVQIHDGQLEFYREKAETYTTREVTGLKRNLLFSWFAYGDVVHTQFVREVIAVFQPLDWKHYLLIDDKTGYGGIDPDMLDDAQ